MKKCLFVIFVFACLFIVAGCATPPPEPAPEPAPVTTPPPPSPPPQSVTVSPPAQPPAPAPVVEELVLQGASRHTIVYTDTLSLLAARVYGESNMFYFPLIRLANANVVTNPDFIFPGTVLVIPDLQANLNSAGARILLKAEMLSAAVHYERLNQPRAASELRNLANGL